MAGASRRKKAGREAARSGRAGPGQAATLWLGGIGCGAMIVLSPASAILMALLTAPVLLVALLPEDGPGGRVMRAALLFGLAASIHPLSLLWQTDGTLAAAMHLVRQPLILLTAWMSIGAGWLVGELATATLKLTADLAAASRRRAIAATLAELEEEWGPLLPLDDAALSDGAGRAVSGPRSGGPGTPQAA